jgi:hypothetical protein
MRRQGIALAWPRYLARIVKLADQATEQQLILPLSRVDQSNKIRVALRYTLAMTCDHAEAIDVPLRSMQKPVAEARHEGWCHLS